MQEAKEVHKKKGSRPYEAAESQAPRTRQPIKKGGKVKRGTKG
jgi:hypothetical protein